MMRFLLLCLGFLLTSCTVANLAVPASTAVHITPRPTTAELAALPATSTAILATTAVAPLEANPTNDTANNNSTATAVLAATASPAAPEPAPSATFAAYGTTFTLGKTVLGQPIVAYNFGFGSDKLVFIGGMHGGYEWNTITLAYEAIDYFTAHPELIPGNVRLIIIPSLNVDGQYLVTGSNGRLDPSASYSSTIPGRFNANTVDLNRNWDCEWAPLAQWQDKEVSGGTAPFSEPETELLRRFFLWEQPEVVLFWHSKSNGVFAAGCPDTYAPSLELATLYGEAAGYPVFEDFAAYPVTGDASNWLALQGIPSFTVELKNHTNTDWPENLAGIMALLAEYGRDKDD